MYVNTRTNQYPYTIGDFRNDNKNTSFPRYITDSILSRYGVKPVHTVDDPSYDSTTQKIVEADTPTRETDGTDAEGNNIYTGRWILAKTVETMTSDEVTANDTLVAKRNRATRDRLLAETDYLALSDNTLTAAMTTYRQSLRDITDHDDWPHLADDDWPTKP